jgi:hypothetical protein
LILPRDIAEDAVEIINDELLARGKDAASASGSVRTFISLRPISATALVS